MRDFPRPPGEHSARREGIWCGLAKFVPNHPFGFLGETVRHRRIASLLAVPAVAVAAFAVAPIPVHPAASAAAPGAALPVVFETNTGQADPPVRYLARSGGS